MKFVVGGFSGSLDKIHIGVKSSNMSDTLHEDVSKFIGALA